MARGDSPAMRYNFRELFFGREAAGTRKLKAAIEKLKPLPGNEHARYALPLDHPPSASMRARWGYDRPPIESLYSWLAARADSYRDVLASMRGFGAELRGLPHSFDPALQPTPMWLGTAMNPIDSLALYAFIRKHRPASFVEIGSGMTTCFAHAARQRNATTTRIVSIDPAPRAEIDAICDQAIRHGLEDCDMTIFDSLVAGDIVFMDGSHRSFMSSDVTVFFIDVLPRLRPGVIVHMHDIFLPWDYPPAFANWYWNEQYLLAVYLMGNRERITPLLPTFMLTEDPMFAADIEKPFIDTDEPLPWTGGGSMWFTHR